MQVFVTGATGFIGSAVVSELIGAGHEVVGLARSDASAAALEAAGAEPHRGSLEDLESLASGAAAADGVIHCAFIHDFSQMVDSGETDRRAIEALGEALAGSDRPLIVTSGTAIGAQGRLATEKDMGTPGSSHRVASEYTAMALVSRGVRSSILRPPPSVHGEGDHGFVPRLVEIARDKRLSGYVGDGSARWAAVHRLDAARLYRLALENAPAGTVLHAVGDEGVPTREIAEAIGRHLDIPAASIAPEEAGEHFGWLGRFFAMDIPASSALTRESLGWEPTQPGLVADLEAGHYYDPVRAVAA